MVVIMLVVTDSNDFAGMTEEEMKVFVKLISVWNSYISLPVEHESDQREFQHHFHILQRMIMSRPVRRNLKTVYIPMESE